MRPNEEGAEDYAALMITGMSHQPTKALSRSAPGKQQNAAENGGDRDVHGGHRHCMSRCMVRKRSECRLGAHRRAAAVTSRFTARTTISMKIERSPANPAVTAGPNMPTAKN